MRLTAAVISTLLTIASAQAGASGLCERTDPATDLACNTLGSLTICSLEAENGMMTNDLARLRACLAEKRPIVKGVYGRSVAALAKKGNAAGAAKSLYASWLTAFDGVMPRTDEPRNEWARRVNRSKDTVEEKGNVLKVEAGVE